MGNSIYPSIHLVHHIMTIDIDRDLTVTSVLDFCEISLLIKSLKGYYFNTLPATFCCTHHPQQVAV